MIAVRMTEKRRVRHVVVWIPERPGRVVNGPVCGNLGRFPVFEYETESPDVPWCTHCQATIRLLAEAVGVID